ncbi:MAG: helix-turn-helix transcriptional regulator [Ruminococcaceae bacterium]|nr:helix-turn-helix transcriptional regulator [Oscillospiraceae bacterium]
MDALRYDAVGARIARYRKMLGWTQERLAEEADLSKNFVSKLETGNCGARLDVYYRISMALDVSLDALVSDLVPADSASQARSFSRELTRFSPLQKRLLNDYIALLRQYDEI